MFTIGQTSEKNRNFEQTLANTSLEDLTSSSEVQKK